MYSTTEEYREQFRIITQMDPTTYYSDDIFHIDAANPEIDEETLDEFHYDESAVSVYLDKVYAQTESSPLFQALYDSAAALMISTDRQIGLTILYSYDYLSLFYPCYNDFVRTPEAFSETNQHYAALLRNLVK
jgi:hypothetical protein